MTVHTNLDDHMARGACQGRLACACMQHGRWHADCKEHALPVLHMHADLPSKSISLLWATSNRFLPIGAWTVCSLLSLSMNVTLIL